MRTTLAAALAARHCEACIEPRIARSVAAQRQPEASLKRWDALGRFTGVLRLHAPA